MWLDKYLPGNHGSFDLERRWNFSTLPGNFDILHFHVFPRFSSRASRVKLLSWSVWRPGFCTILSLCDYDTILWLWQCDSVIMVIWFCYHDQFILLLWWYDYMLMMMWCCDNLILSSSWYNYVLSIVLIMWSGHDSLIMMIWFYDYACACACVVFFSLQLFWCLLGETSPEKIGRGFSNDINDSLFEIKLKPCAYFILLNLLSPHLILYATRLCFKPTLKQSSHCQMI